MTMLERELESVVAFARAAAESDDPGAAIGEFGRRIDLRLLYRLS